MTVGIKTLKNLAQSVGIVIDVLGEYDSMEEVALEMFKHDATDEHVAEVTGLKVNVSFEKVED